MPASIERLILPSIIWEDCDVLVAPRVIRAREVLIPGRYLKRVFGVRHAQSGVGYWQRILDLERQVDEIFAGQINFS